MKCDFMKPSTRFLLLIQCLALLALVGGCASAGTNVEVKQPPAFNLSKYKIIAVEVTTKDPDFDTKEINQLTGAVLDGLKASGKFDKVYGSSSPDEHDATLKLSVVVQFVVGPNMDKVQSIETSVTLMDIATGNTLARANANSHTEWALWGGNMPKAITRLGNQIVDFATNH
jgi:hypothetical protein